MELSLCVPVWFIELHLSLAMLQKLPESEMCARWCLCAYYLCALVVWACLVQAVCVCVWLLLTCTEWTESGWGSPVCLHLADCLFGTQLSMAPHFHRPSPPGKAKVCCNSSTPAVFCTDQICVQASKTHTHLPFNYPPWYGCSAIRTRAKPKCCCSRADVRDDQVRRCTGKLCKWTGRTELYSKLQGTLKISISFI